MPLSDDQIRSFQRRLEGRVENLDTEGRLQRFYLEYCYWPDLNFGHIFSRGKLFRPAAAFLEAYDNAPKDRLGPLLVFSRPRDYIYIMGQDTFAAESLLSILYTKVGDIPVFIARLDDYLKVARWRW
jgi:hypothetical protein